MESDHHAATASAQTIPNTNGGNAIVMAVPSENASSAKRRFKTETYDTLCATSVGRINIEACLQCQPYQATIATPPITHQRNSRCLRSYSAINPATRQYGAASSRSATAPTAHAT